MDVELRIVADPASAAREAARVLVESVRRGSSIGLSGGSTPRAAYELAAATEEDWSRADLWLVDERCVPTDDPRSNQRLVRTAILDRVTTIPRLHPLATERGAEQAALLYDAALRTEGVPELVLLGIGTDGHTASLFPGSPALEAHGRLAVAAEAGLEPLVARITLTLDAIGRAATVVFLATGAGKADVVRLAFGAAPSHAVPASLARSTAGTTIAILDAAAAGGL